MFVEVAIKLPDSMSVKVLIERDSKLIKENRLLQRQNPLKIQLNISNFLS